MPNHVEGAQTGNSRDPTTQAVRALRCTAMWLLIPEVNNKYVPLGMITSCNNRSSFLKSGMITHTKGLTRLTLARNRWSVDVNGMTFKLFQSYRWYGAICTSVCQYVAYW